MKCVHFCTVCLLSVINMVLCAVNNGYSTFIIQYSQITNRFTDFLLSKAATMKMEKSQEIIKLYTRTGICNLLGILHQCYVGSSNLIRSRVSRDTFLFFNLNSLIAFVRDSRGLRLLCTTTVVSAPPQSTELLQTIENSLLSSELN